MPKYDNILRSLSGAVNLILPPRCPVTGEIVDRPGMVSPTAWASLRFVSVPHCACCGLPFDLLTDSVLPDDQTLCGSCLAVPKLYAQARASLVYDDASRALILGFKHGDQTHLTVTFAPWLLNAGRDFISSADAIIPVPLHWLRLLRRRYNQAALLGHAVGKLSGIPCWPDALRRGRNTPTQGHLNARQRHENVRHAFEVRPEFLEQVKDKRIILIDDVYTTGATVEECVKVLQMAGVQRVDVLTLARVVRPDILA